MQGILAFDFAVRMDDFLGDTFLVVSVACEGFDAGGCEVGIGGEEIY